ncbi:methyltransferase domain-containing protein [Filobacillus milosensis]|uniref:Methyltransferase domain-containing protein n=1 Tax=Filobacillus milosensis TaxID=94137 RepID=A0A4Y8IK36_9BACI|nr:methyltransferase domain-containing protein [Filobacillus milosensis]TFB21360.1 methyltransferase domain-containing protein [Filobacillus milosensis]
MKKIDRFKGYLKQNDNFFSCPICHSSMRVEESSVVCDQNHSFDIAKKGYVNFLTQPVQTKYDKDLFDNRQKVIDSGMYQPVHETISKMIEGPVTMIDLGCGEGSHLAKIQDTLDSSVIAAGIDLSKEGIMKAAKNHLDTMWCVGDLAKTPFRDSAFDVALNILSPANYDEFKRLMADDGLLIKVVPNQGYLKELRQRFNKNEDYNNEETVKRFKESMIHVRQERVAYQFKMDSKLFQSLIKMTPLTWNQDVENIEPIDEITIDLDILVGKI